MLLGIPAFPYRDPCQRSEHHALAEAILPGEIKPGEVIKVTVNEDGKGLLFTQEQPVGS